MKRKIMPLLFIILSLCSCGSKTDYAEKNNISLNEQTLEQLQISTEAVNTQYIPLNFNCQKAVWFTMADHEKMVSNKTEEEFTDDIENLMEKIKNTGFNTVYVHIRPYNDAYYKSEIFPPAPSCSDDFDSFEIIIKTAHSLNLSVHGWINPLRCQTENELKSLDDKYKIKSWYDDQKKKGSYICMVNDRWYLNPAYEEVRQYIADGAREIAENYDVDGIHIDDYFYPTSEEDFDKAAFAETGQTDLQQWRTDNINLMVKEIYDTIKDVDPKILFGISPQGNMYIDYSTLYADVKRWSSEEGYCDYIVPQVYYGFKNENMPFEQTVYDWQSENSCDKVDLIIGVCTYKIGMEDKWAGSGKDEWKTDKNIPSRQAEFVLDNSCGIAVYSIETLFDEKNKEELNLLTDVLNEEIYE